MGLAFVEHNFGDLKMTRDEGKPLRLFVDPFAAWRELAFKTAEMIAASVQAGAAASRARVAVIDQRERLERPPPKAAAKKKHKKRAKRR
jgi:hypothetical protein